MDKTNTLILVTYIILYFRLLDINNKINKIHDNTKIEEIIEIEEILENE